MELHELQVAHLGAGAPGHGQAVARGDVRVAGVEVDLAAAAGGQHHRIGQIDPALEAVAIQHHRPHHPSGPLAAEPELAAAQQLQAHVVLFHGDPRIGVAGGQQARLDLATGQVAAVQDPPARVPALAAQGEAAGVARLVPAEVHAVGQQPLDERGSGLHQAPDHRLVAEPVAGGQGVPHVQIELVQG